jgi:seryl-tRNA synthetase
MLLVANISSDVEGVRKRLEQRNFTELHLVDEAVELDRKRRDLQTKKDGLLSRRNDLSKEIGKLFQAGRQADAEEMKATIAGIKEEVSALDSTYDEVLGQLRDILLTIPNLPHESVPKGHTEDDNEVVFQADDPLNFPEAELPHWDLAVKYDIIDFETAVKISGAGFAMFKGKGAVLQRALINFFLNEAIAAGYTEVVPPLLVNEDSAFGTGQLPDKEGQMYHVTGDDLYLIPTAEVPITNIYRDVIVGEDELPVKLVGYTPCFRREAGSYGSHVRGLNRVHQFDKVEIVQIVEPSTSYATLDAMVEHVAGLLKKLDLPYRVVRLCGGDLGFTSALTYDFEVYSAAQDRWLECSSVSNFESFQANRLKLRYKDAEKKPRLCHTLNGSALALARIIACILENNQTGSGIRVPEVLQPFTGFKMID